MRILDVILGEANASLIVYKIVSCCIYFVKMSADTEQIYQNDQTAEKDNDDPNQCNFDLYIKASPIDKETRGPCPLCQQWFMIAYLMAENQEGVVFKVFTVQADCPPKLFVDKGWSKTFPVVIAKKPCRNKAGHDLADEMFDTFEELEKFFEGINRSCPELKRHNAPNANAVLEVADIYAVFCGFLKGSKKLTQLERKLEELNDYLESNEGKFLVDDVLSFADCHLLPRLQHLRVAAEKYCNYQIPSKFTALWKYLDDAYHQPAFINTLPSDQDIVYNYEKKTAFPLPKRGNPTLQAFTYTKDIPEEVKAVLNKKTDDQEVMESNGESALNENESSINEDSTVNDSPE